MNKEKPSLWSLYMAFFRIGLFTFGGGYAMLPMLEKEVVDKYRWASYDELMDYFAIAQGTPGIIAVNTATFIGTKYRGFVGGVITTMGVVTPSWIIISIIAKGLEQFHDNSWVASAFSGIRIVVIALILSSLIKMGKKAIIKWFDYGILALAFFGSVVIGLSPVMIIGLGIILNLMVLIIRGGKSWRY